MKKWERVHGPDLQPQHKERSILNKNVFESGNFKEACSNAGITPTIRQASKFRKKSGLAYKMRNKS